MIPRRAAHPGSSGQRSAWPGRGRGGGVGEQPDIGAPPAERREVARGSQPPVLQRLGPTPTMPTCASGTGNAVDPLPDEVGVAVVARVLLDHVQVDPADVAGALRVLTVAGHDVIEVFSGHGGARVLYFLFECLEVGGRVRVIERFEVLAGLVW